MRLPVLAASPTGYANLVGAMSERALATRGEYSPTHSLDDVGGAGSGLRVLTGGVRGPLMRALRAGGPVWERFVRGLRGR